VARRVRDLTSAFSAELQGDAPLSVTQEAAVRKAAGLLSAAEDLRARALRGDPVDMPALVKLENLADRAVRALHRKRARPPAPSLGEYLRSKAQA